ncbi:MAG: hypothetical protein LBK70_00115 [Clostridiales bacterium]|jgi:fatty acid desaturase|nr:hypothetical protein [Clostridiales bacterium]
MKLQNYELIILLIGLVSFNASYIMQPFFASRSSVRLRADKYTIVLLLIAMLTVCISFALFFTDLGSVMIWIMLVVFLIISVFSWRHTLGIIKSVKQARWAYHRQRGQRPNRANTNRSNTNRPVTRR